MNLPACRPLRGALLPALVLLPLLGRAQTPRAGGLHTAPGKPLHLQRGPAAPYAPPRAVAPTVLPRYWAAPDSAARAAGRTQLYGFVHLKARYPTLALRSATVPEGLLRFRLRVYADGSIGPPELVQRRLTLADSAYDPAAVAALEAAAKQAFARLRFAPSASPVDTVSVGINFYVH